jgi:hypothetical protein
MLGGVKNTLLFGLLIVNLSGCVGYYQSKSSGPVEKDLTLAILVVPQDERKIRKSEQAQLLKEKKLVNDERALPLGTIPVGQKDQKKDQIIKEVKIYNDKTRWCGRTIWAIIPIPLLSPSCRTYTELTFENDEPISAQEQYVEDTGHICGPFIPMMKFSKASSQEGFCVEIGEIE